jgi:acetylornithine deacetylase
MLPADRRTGGPIPESALDLALELMRHDSTSGREGEVITRAESLLAERGWAPVRIPVSPGRDCLFASAGGDPDVTLSTHLDTVPPYVPPRVEDGVLFGRGACDAKGIAASMLVAASRLRERGVSAALLFVIGEETEHDGARAANAWIAEHLPRRTRVLINGEPTENTLAVGTKGAMRVLVRTSGRAAHSAYPELGESAIEKLVGLLTDLGGLSLPSDPVLGATTINIGSISGGVADNVIAPHAEARLMARLVTPSGEVWRVLQAWAGGRAQLQQGVTVPAVRLATLDGFPTSVAAFATDIPSLTNWGTPYLYGPGSVHVAHTLDEHVRAEDLERAVEAYVRIAAEGRGRG